MIAFLALAIFVAYAVGAPLLFARYRLGLRWRASVALVALCATATLLYMGARS